MCTPGRLSSLEEPWRTSGDRRPAGLLRPVMPAWPGMAGIPGRSSRSTPSATSEKKRNRPGDTVTLRSDLMDPSRLADALLAAAGGALAASVRTGPSLVSDAWEWI
jgi:hypothetical protein